MNKEKLIDFINIIVKNNHPAYASNQLAELKEILMNHSVDEEMIHLISDAIENVGEIINESKHGPLNEKQMRIAIERSKEQARRFEEMRRNGRC